jgi:hypothetical protein
MEPRQIPQTSNGTVSDPLLSWKVRRLTHPGLEDVVAWGPDPWGLPRMSLAHESIGLSDHSIVTPRRLATFCALR